MKPLKAIYFRDWEQDRIPEIIKEIYWEGLYDEYILPDNIVVDFGANVGLFTWYAYLKGAKTIYSVEPSKQHFELLKKMVKTNKLDDKVILENSAISNKDGTSTFYHSEQNTTMFSLNSVIQDNDTSTEKVKLMAFDTFIKKHKIKTIDFLKMDIEGEEGKVITSDGFKKYAHIVKKMISEVHIWTGMSNDQYVQALEDLGFKNKVLNTEATLFLSERI